MTGEAKRDFDRAKSKQEKVIGLLVDGLHEPDDWRGWDFWRCVTFGGFDPAIILRDWTLIDVWETSYNLQVKTVLESIE